ncbi:MAG: hypothetical protein RBS80_24630 [Thermoguttaceae bacterium]|nr:hypothetical protein [Thermoguttaceae bacterium]
MTASANPLRTRRLEQLSFRAPPDGSPFSWTRFLVELYSPRVQGRGAILGPHGSGKTTFLVELKRRLEAQRRKVVMLLTNRDGGRRLPREWLAVLRRTDLQTLVIADGYDVLGPLARWQLRRMLRPRGGLLVTAHRRCALPALLNTRTSLPLLVALADELYAPVPDAPRPTDETLSDLFHSCHGNLREVFRRLYAMS